MANSGARRGTSIDVDSTAFLAGLQREVGALKLSTERELSTLGLLVQNNARELCPVDTGRLRSSIFLKKGRDLQGPYVEVGTVVKYALPVEFGTSRQRAQPYLRPAFAEAVRAAASILGRR